MSNVTCPKCGGADLRQGDAYAYESLISAPVECEGCGEKWDELGRVRAEVERLQQIESAAVQFVSASRAIRRSRTAWNITAYNASEDNLCDVVEPKP